jgi:hypothetical protein
MRCLMLMLLSAVKTIAEPVEPWIVVVEENHVYYPAGQVFSQVIEWSWSDDQCQFCPERWVQLKDWKGRRPDLVTHTDYDPEQLAKRWFRRARHGQGN